MRSVGTISRNIDFRKYKFDAHENICVKHTKQNKSDPINITNNETSN